VSNFSISESVLHERPITERSRLRQAWGGFVAQFPWEWFCAFSFRGMLDRRTGEMIDVPPGTAHNLFAGFCKDIQRVAGGSVVWFRADEYGPRGGRLHIHALLSGVAHLRRLSWLDEWGRRAGWARIFPFDPTRGGARYAAKYVVKQQGDWELHGLPALRLPCQEVVYPLDGVISRKAVDEWPVLHHPTVPQSGRFPRRDWESEMLRTSERWRMPRIGSSEQSAIGTAGERLWRRRPKCDLMNPSVSGS
jgi:hypothetical protein